MLNIKDIINMKREVFIVESVIYDESDSYLWSNAKAFAREDEAARYFRKESAEMYADAQGADYLDPDDYYPVDTICETETQSEYDRDADGPVRYKVRLHKQEIEF